MLRRIALCALLIGVSLAHSQSAAAADPQYSDENAVITVTILRPTSLGVVFDWLCELSTRRCEGTALTSQHMLAPCVIKGSWREVVQQLMQGTGLNYVTSEGSTQVQSTLVIAERTVVVAAALPAATSPSGGNVAAPEREARINQLEETPANAPGDDREPAPVDDAMVQQEFANPGSGLQSFLPFPDAHGRPIAASAPVSSGSAFPLGPMPSQAVTQSQGFLPLPDSQGNPIPARPAPGVGYPFGPKPLPNND